MHQLQSARVQTLECCGHLEIIQSIEGMRKQASGLVAYLLPTMSDKNPPRGRAQKFIIPKMEAKLAALLVEKPNCDPR